MLVKKPLLVINLQAEGTFVTGKRNFRVACTFFSALNSESGVLFWYGGTNSVRNWLCIIKAGAANND